jgi:hypothetical protein
VQAEGRERGKAEVREAGKSSFNRRFIVWGLRGVAADRISGRREREGGEGEEEEESVELSPCEAGMRVRAVAFRGEGRNGGAAACGEGACLLA